MLFYNRNEFVVRELVSSRDVNESFLIENGYPVELYLVDTTSSNILATPEQIAWVDEGEDVETLREISVDDINRILYDDYLYIDIEETGGHDVIPRIIEGKVVIQLINI